MRLVRRLQRHHRLLHGNDLGLKTCSNLDAALTANSHQRPLLVDVHRHGRLHVFDPDLDLLVVAHRVEIFLLVDLVQVDKLSLQIENAN